MAATTTPLPGPGPGQTESAPRPNAATTKPKPTTAAITPAQQSAQTQLNITLGMYGLGSLGTWAWKQYLAGKSVDQIFLDIRQTPEYKARFPAMDALSKMGAAITEQQYVQLEATYKQLYHAAGLPSGFYDDPSDFAKLISGQVSPTELKSRLDLATTAVYSAPAETRQALSDLYGLSPGDLTAFWIDPDRALPVIQQQYAAAEAAGTSSRVGFGSLSRTEAERIAQVGLTPEALATGFGQLVNERELFGVLPGEGGDNITHATQIEALTGDAEAQKAIDDRARQRVAAFGDKSRGFADTTKGITGLGENPT